MRILHLYANWKWTGPAEPATNLASGLARRGHEVLFLPGRVKGNPAGQIAEAARERGLEVDERLDLPKHHRFLGDRRDMRALAELIRESRPDLVHCHLPNDHLVAAGAVRRSGVAVPVVRSLYDGRPPPRGLRSRRTLLRSTALLLSASERVRRETAERFRIPVERTRTVEGAVDLSRFDPERKLPDLRGEYGIREGDFVLGIVARIQPQRRFEIFFDALDRVAADVPHLRVVLVGRGTHIRKVAEERAERAILRNRIVFTGYRRGDEYVSTLASLSAKVFLWPGSDGSCRAVREFMAMGVPVIAAREGMLDEIVTDGEDGILIPHHPEALAHAVRRLALGLAERDEMAAAARGAARARFDLEVQVATVEEAYRGIL